MKDIVKGLAQLHVDNIQCPTCHSPWWLLQKALHFFVLHSESFHSSLILYFVVICCSDLFFQPCGGLPDSSVMGPAAQNLTGSKVNMYLSLLTDIQIVCTALPWYTKNYPFVTENSPFVTENIFNADIINSNYQAASGGIVFSFTSLLALHYEIFSWS